MWAAEPGVRRELDLVVDWPLGHWLPEGWFWERGASGGMLRARGGTAWAVHVCGCAIALRLCNNLADEEQALEHAEHLLDLVAD